MEPSATETLPLRSASVRASLESAGWQRQVEVVGCLSSTVRTRRVKNGYKVITAAVIGRHPISHRTKLVLMHLSSLSI